MKYFVTLILFLTFSTAVKAVDFRKNVVQITSTYQLSQSEDGFGIIIGENVTSLFIVTAAHVVLGDTAGLLSLEDDVEIGFTKISFWGIEGFYKGEMIKNYLPSLKLDLALIKVRKPTGFHFHRDVISKNYSVHDEVRYIGVNRQIKESGKGEILGHFRNILDLTFNDVGAGISGAAVVNESGIIGMVTKSVLPVKARAFDFMLIEEILFQDNISHFFQLRNVKSWVPSENVIEKSTNTEGNIITTISLRLGVNQRFSGKYNVIIAPEPQNPDKTRENDYYCFCSEPIVRENGRLIIIKCADFDVEQEEKSLAKTFYDLDRNKFFREPIRSFLNTAEPNTNRTLIFRVWYEEFK